MHRLRTTTLPIRGTWVAILWVVGCSGSEASNVPTPASAINAYKGSASGQTNLGAAGTTSNNGANRGAAPVSATGAGPSSSELSRPIELTQGTDAGTPRPSMGPVPSASADAGAPAPGSDDSESDDSESDDD
jgi:hypothetical protein